MEIRVNIPKNDYVQPTEVRQEVVQDICNHIIFWMNKGVIEKGYYEIRIKVHDDQSNCMCLVYRKSGETFGFTSEREKDVPEKVGSNYKRIRTVEMEAVFEAMQDAGYYIFGSHCITNNEHTYVFTTKPFLGRREARRIMFGLFID